MDEFFDRLKQRKIVQWSLAYAAAAFALIQIFDIVAQRFAWPEQAIRFLIIAFAIGFFVTLVLAWYHGERGTQRVSGTELLILALLLAIGGAVAWRLAPNAPPANAEASVASTAKPAVVESDQKSIAVMPFRDLSPTKDQEYFSEGMAEEILDALTKVRSLRVLGRSSSFQYKGRDVTPRTIGLELGVAHLLSGSVRKEGDLLRIAVQLIGTSDGVQQWSKQYNGKLTDVFDLQDSCARDVASELNITLGHGHQDRLVDKATDNPNAYAKFIEAQALVTLRFGDSLPRAITLLNEAIALDSHFARAWAKLGVAHAVIVQYVGGDWNAHWVEAEKAVQQALTLDPNNAEAYAVRGYIELSQRKFLDMVAPTQRSLELDPEDITGNFWVSNQLASMGRMNAALLPVERALGRDPDNPLLVFYKANLLWALHQSDESLIFARRAEALHHPLSGLALAYAAARNGDPKKGSIDFAQSMAALGTKIPQSDIATIFIGVYEIGDAHAKALDIIERYRDDEYVPTLLIMLGEPERSFALFEKSKTGLSDAYFDWLWTRETWSRRARQSPAFQGFAKRMGMIDYWKREGWPDFCQPAPSVGLDAFTCQ